MASSPKVLLILFEGLPGTVIESQVLVHAREMAMRGIAEFEIWAFACSTALYRRSVAAQPRARELADCPVRVFRGVRPAVPFSTMLNALAVAAAMLRYRPRIDLVHARTDYSTLVVACLSRWRRNALIWDCRGDSVAEFAERFRPPGRLLRWVKSLRLRLLARDRRRAARACDRAIFVTKELERIAAPDLADKPRRIIPCPASEALFGFDEGLREAARRDLGFGAEDRVYIFSGSLAAYQCFDESLSLFSQIQQRNGRAKLLILSPEEEEARRRLSGNAGIRDAVLRSAPISQMNRYLNAADAAFMMRAPTAVNLAAFPTKFAEYCLAGLPVIMTRAVPDACEIAERLGNLMHATVSGAMEPPAGFDRRRVADDARTCLTRASVAPLYAEIYRMPHP
jgi:hypothetical protein